MTNPRYASSSLLPSGLVFSDTPSRLVAFLLDGLVLGPANGVIFALLGFDYSRFGPGVLPDRNVWVASTVIAFAIDSAYFVWFWSGGRRATPGQRVLGIQVANAFDGKSLTAAQAFNRYLGMGQWLGLFSVLPYLSIALLTVVASFAWYLVLTISAVMSPTKQGLHDRFAGSAVVRPAAAGNGWALGCLGLLVLLTVFYVLIIAVALTSTAPSIRNDSFFEYMQQTFRWFWPQ
jgi:uncharacterized RDD family membrane protein YckC